MAIDTETKRRSVHAYSGGDAALVMPVPDGTIEVNDRAHLLSLYGSLFSLTFDANLASVALAFALVTDTTVVSPSLAIGLIADSINPVLLSVGIIADSVNAPPLGVSIIADSVLAVPLAVGVVD